MEDKIVFKFINKIKDKLSKNKTTYPAFDEYAFSTEEIKTITKQNKEKIQELKQDIFSKQKKEQEEIKIPENNITEFETDKEIVESSKEITENDNRTAKLENNESDLKIDKKEEHLEVKEQISNKEEIENKEQIKEGLKEEQPKNSFINLNEEYQKIVMNKWKEIDYKQLDKDIIDGKDLLNHNYTITYADDAAKFIHNIRKKYEVVICYLIGFNNEKKGIYEKTIFSDKMENEWKHLNNYIKVLEKIRSFRK